MAATVVLVHGAWHGAWCWDRLRAELDRAGVANVAVDNPSVTRANATLHDDADAVTAVLEGLSGDVVLVGHSFGGAIVTDAGVHARVRHVVYVAAFALAEGESVTENALTGGGGSDLESAVRIDGDVATVDPAGAVAAFYHDCPEDLALDAVARLRPQSLSALRGGVRNAAWTAKPSTYVLCTDDRAVPVELQRSSAARTGAVVEIDASHSPFLSRPRELSAVLAELAR